MPKDIKKGVYKFEVQVKSKVHPGVQHTVSVDLYCNEKLDKKTEKGQSKSPKK